MPLRKVKTESDSVSVLDVIRKSPGGIPKRDIFPQIPLSWGSMCQVVKKALQKGYITSLESRNSIPGRPCIPLQIVPDVMYLIGVDVGSCTTKLLIYDFALQIVHQNAVPTEPFSTVERFLEWLTDFIQANIPEELRPKIRAAGIAVSGTVDNVSGTIISGGNFGMPYGTNINIQKLSQRLDLPCCTLNTLSAAALAEYHFGNFAGVGDLLTVSIGCGIGSGVVSGHKLQLSQGKNPLGNIGHLLIPDNPYRCAKTNCCFIGCLEAFSGSKNLCRIAAEQKIADGNITTIDLDKMASAGDPGAGALLKKAAKYNAIGIASVIQSYSPEAVILSGGQCKEDGFLYQSTLQELYNLIPGDRCTFKISLSVLGEHQPAMGAARMAYERFLDL